MMIESPTTLPPKQGWQVFSAAPHRMMFFGGAVQLVLATAWWFYDLAARFMGLLPYHPPVIPPAFAHLFFMIDGFMPFFMFGFLFTAAPRWLNVQPPPAATYVKVFFCMSAGGILLDAGLFTSRLLMAAGAAVYLAGWALGWVTTVRFMLANLQADRRHLLPIGAALAMGLAGVAAYIAWLLTQRPALLEFSRIAGIWLFLLPVFLSVGHRMIPFFSSAILGQDEKPWRPYPLLWLFLAGLAAHALLELAGLQNWLLACDLPLAVAGLFTTVHWHFRRSFQNRLLAMLHIGFSWFGIGMLLFSIQDLLHVVLPGGPEPMAWAPLHALTMGFFLSLMLAMVSRVSLGHSGRRLEASDATWRLFLAFQAGVILRVLADILPAQGTAVFYTLAAATALACFAVWFWLYAPLYLRPRTDHRPG